MNTRLAFPTLLLTFASLPLFADANLSSDELAVRAVYTAVVLRSQIGSVYSTYLGDNLSTSPQLAIRLSNLHAGPISEIVSTPIAKLVTLPTPELLLSGPGSFSLNDQHVAGFLQDIHWGPVNQRYNFNNDYSTFDAPLSKALETVLAGNGPAFNRYLRFTVSVSAQGKERSYQALALFREHESAARTIDYILSPPEDLIGNDLVPDLVGLPTNLHIADQAKLKAFINSLAMAGPCLEDPTTKLCCDSATKQCGISSRVLTAHN